MDDKKFDSKALKQALSHLNLAAQHVRSLLPETPSPQSDALLLTARTEGGATVKEAFYFLLKPDGTFDVDTVNREGCHFRRVRLASLLKHYGMTDDVKHYNLKKEIENWKGREVEVVLSEDGAHIHVPQGGS